MTAYTQFFKGEGKSRFDQEGFDSTDNLDVHTELGSARCQLALTLDSATPSEASFSAVVPNGDTYYCSKSTGKIWKRTQAGSWSLVHTNVNTVHRGARYYNGYLYFWTASKLGRFDLSSSWSDSWATFTNSNAQGSEELNLNLYICDGKYIARVNTDGVFAANALDFPANHVAQCCVGYQTSLIVGTSMGNYVTNAKVFVWDTYSDSWIIEDEVFEIGVNLFIKADNIILAQAGTAGTLYYWTGQTMELLGKIRGVTTASGHQMACVLNGKPLIAIGTDIYSIYKADKDFPIAITHEYTASGSIGSIVAQGNQLFASYTGGVDKIGTDRAIAKITTPEAVGTFSIVEVGYSSLPTGTSIGIETSVNGASYAAQTSIIDTINKKVYFNGGLTDHSYMQARITLNPYTTSTPIITNISIL